MAGHVFLTFSASDAGDPYIEAVLSRLTAAGLTVHAQQETHSHTITPATRKLVDACGVLVPIIMPATHASERVRLEVEYAREQSKPVLALWVDGSVPDWLLGDVDNVTGRRPPSDPFVQRLHALAVAAAGPPGEPMELSRRSARSGRRATRTEEPPVPAAPASRTAPAGPPAPLPVRQPRTQADPMAPEHAWPAWEPPAGPGWSEPAPPVPPRVSVPVPPEPGTPPWAQLVAPAPEPQLPAEPPPPPPPPQFQAHSQPRFQPPAPAVRRQPVPVPRQPPRPPPARPVRRPPPRPEPTAPTGPPARSGWRRLGLVLAVLVGLAGLAAASAAAVYFTVRS